MDKQRNFDWYRVVLFMRSAEITVLVSQWSNVSYTTTEKHNCLVCTIGGFGDAGAMGGCSRSDGGSVSKILNVYSSRYGFDTWVLYDVPANTTITLNSYSGSAGKGIYAVG